jgi:hypothetical protein
MRVTTNELLTIADKPGLWISIDGMSETLRAALERAARINAQGRVPYRLQGPADVEVGHSQMLELWKRLGILPASSAIAAKSGGNGDMIFASSCVLIAAGASLRPERRRRRTDAEGLPGC